MSSNHEFFAECWNNEHPVFLKVLRALPHEQLDYKPHEKNTAAGELAWQLAEEQRGLATLIDTGVIDWEQKPRPGTLDEIVSSYEAAGDALKSRLSGITEEKWNSPGDFRMGGQSVWAGKIKDLAWGFLFDTIHHRGQLSAYIRPMGGKVPSIYGPSADDAGGPASGAEA
jgi:uncharacterized damage-inducible protein DinB